MYRELPYRNIATFVQSEAARRGMSLREFARFAKVSSASIVRLVDEDNKHEPSLTILTRIASATKVDLCALVALLEPEATRVNPEAAILSERIQRLPAEARSLIDALIMGALFKKGD